jgi:hypothetical protein
MPPGRPAHTVLLDPRITPKEVTVRTDMKRLLLGCLLALLLVPAAANAAFTVGDSPHAVRAENGPGSAASAPAAPPTIVRNITTHEGSQTVPVVLAALALSVAIAGTGYVALRVRPSLRS